MKIGLLSDSHGKAERTARAAQKLVDAGAEALVHLGDINTPPVLDALLCALDGEGAAQPPVHVVFGNTDIGDEALLSYARNLGFEADADEIRLEANGKILSLQHGHRPETIRRALADRVHYLCHGHTHERCDERVNTTRIVNPGALQRAREYTAALLDTRTDTIEWFTIDP